MAGVNIFNKILADALKAGKTPKQMTESLSWFHNRVKKFGTTVRPSDMLRQKKRAQPSFTWGEMYLFSYNPKHRRKLKHYDTFPMVFPVQPAKDGFLGINLHYLPYSYRAALMDALYNLRSNDKIDETTILMLSYEILNKASKFSYFKPCLKHYLTNQIRSRFIKIESVEWPIALFLPLERFEKESKEKVWNQVRRSL